MKKTIVITGGTGGIGLQTAMGLAKTGAQIVVTGRSKERGEQSVEQIKEASGNDDVHLAVGDLSLQGGIKALASDLLRCVNKIDVLINNAGVSARELTRTEDGFELNFAVNVVAPYTLTRLLKPALKAASLSRVINVTGGARSGKVDVANLQAEKGFLGLNTYSHSKRALEAMSLSLARELEPQGIFVNIVYPGTASTSLTRGMKASALPWMMLPLYPFFRLLIRDDGGKSAQKAARSSIWAADADETLARSGQYFDSNCKSAKFHASIYDPANQEAVIATITRTLS